MALSEFEVVSVLSEPAGQPAALPVGRVALASLFDLPAWSWAESGADGRLPTAPIDRGLALPSQAVDLLLAVTDRRMPWEASESDFWLPDRDDLDDADGDIPLLALDTALAERDAGF